MFWFKVCENSYAITKVKVIDVFPDKLVIEDEASFNNTSILQRVGKDYACYPTWEGAHRYLLSFSQTNLDCLRNCLNNLHQQHIQIETWIHPNEMKVPQIA